MLSERELESRYEVWVEQYITNANIEAETAAAIAQTMMLPAALRHLRSEAGSTSAGSTRTPGAGDRPDRERSATLEKANRTRTGSRASSWRVRARQPARAMAEVREVADKLEKVVADDLWPLPKYSEILFVR